MISVHIGVVEHYKSLSPLIPPDVERNVSAVPGHFDIIPQGSPGATSLCQPDLKSYNRGWLKGLSFFPFFFFFSALWSVETGRKL